ncbi:MAG: methyltransferase domain-containing protein [Alphaproteobacteria bacterium]|nr:methyltransferase domain-containing protein [Alphaproteobacteria bacterium]MBT4019181.1 methyltransferase domain-containing protein [Alphaproteobacteria bacterium]MBT5160278.1 methyltransferase domain-containing protein [Alphaproteobacteria bacterium]MBT6385557.1 methyltransferase domain-containing protein [Alphaproteobacteria bacterium]
MVDVNQNTAVETDNAGLQEFYAEKYRDGIADFYSFVKEGETLGLANGADWTGLSVLEVGCGEGLLSGMIADAGAARVLGVDFTGVAIDAAKIKTGHKNLEFRHCDFRDIDEKFDVIVMEGVLEHMDDPLAALSHMAEHQLNRHQLNRPTRILSSSPSFLNPRGYIWMTLQMLFDIPMSLSDLHFLCPFDYEDYAKSLDAKVTWTSVDQDWGHGPRMIEDFDNRLRNALRDKGMRGDVDRLLKWLERTLDYTATTEFSGANLIYDLEFPVPEEV